MPRIPRGTVVSPGAQATSGLYASAHRTQIRDGGGRFAGGWGVYWRGLEDIDANIYDLNDRIHRDIRDGAQSLMEEMVEYMQSNATWTDRTGDARAGLQGAVHWQDPEHFTILLGHGANIYYGVWLEVRFGGRFAIVGPTVRHFAPLMGATIVGAR